MKKVVFIGFAVVAMTVAFSSCSKNCICRDTAGNVTNSDGANDENDITEEECETLNSQVSAYGYSCRME